MPNGQFNPFTAPLTLVKQVGEQTSQAIQTLGSGMTQAASQGLDAMISGVPPLPGAPAPAARAAPSLMPANLQQVLGQVESLLIPPGLPRPSQALGAQGPAPAPTAPAPAGADSVPPAMAQRKRIAERRGL